MTDTIINELLYAPGVAGWSGGTIQHGWNGSGQGLSGNGVAGTPQQGVAQIFTAATGMLANFQVQIENESWENPGNSTFSFDIVPVTLDASGNIASSGASVYHSTLTLQDQASQSPGIVYYEQLDFKPNVALTQGGSYAIVVTPDANSGGDFALPVLNSGAELGNLNYLFGGVGSFTGGQMGYSLDFAPTQTATVTPGLETLVNTQTLNDQFFPSVTTLMGGGYVVVWGEDGSTRGVYGQLYDASGAKVGGETPIASNIVSGGPDNILPSVTALTNGGYFVAWTSATSIGGGNFDYDVHGQRFDASGNPVGGDILINTTTTGTQRFPSVAGLNDGGYVVTWGSPTFAGVYTQRYDAQDRAVGGETLVNPTQPGEGFPNVAALHDGGYVVTWGSGLNIYEHRYDAAGNTVGDAVTQVNTTAAGAADSNVLVLGDGSYLVTWSGQDGVYGQQFDASGAKVGGEARISTTPTASYDHYPEPTLLHDGGYVVVWMNPGQDGSSNGVYLQEFDASGAKVGGETLVNTTTLGDQSHPHVAATADGFVVTWMSSEGQDTSGYGIYQKFFTITDSGPVPTQTPPSAPGEQLFSTRESGVIQGAVGASDTDGDTLTYTVLTGPQHGTLTFDPNHPDQFTYTPNQGFVGAEIVKLQIDDGHGNTITQIDELATNPPNGALVHVGPAYPGEVRSTDDFKPVEAIQQTVVGTSTAVSYVTSPSSGDYVQFQGTGFTYDASGHLTGGTITDVAEVDQGVLVTSVTGLNLLVPGAGATDASVVQAAFSGNDYMEANVNPVLFRSYAGDDTLVGGPANDTFEGGAGNDLLIGGAGNDTIDGGTGTDTLTVNFSGSTAPVSMASGGGTISDGTHTVQFQNIENFSITAGSGGSNIVTGAGDDTLVGGVGGDTLDGGAGHNLIQGGDGADSLYTNGSGTLDGGAGDDYLQDYNGSGPTSLLGGDGKDTIFSNGTTTTMDGGAGDDYLQNSGAGASVLGGDGNDTIYSDAAGTTLDGGAGHDFISNQGSGVSISGGEGNDTITDQTSGNTINGGAGDDLIHAAASGHSTVDGGTGTDTLTVDFSGSTAPVSMASGSGTVTDGTHTVQFQNIENFSITAGSGGSNIVTGAGDDTLVGGVGGDTLDGGAGHNLIQGGDGADNLHSAGSGTIDGGAGGDYIQADATGPIIILGGDGADQINNGRQFGPGPGGAGVSTAPVTIDGGAGDDTIFNWYGDRSSSVTGGDGSDVIRDYVYHTATVDGGAGNDNIYYEGAGDSITGGSGNDFIQHNGMNDTVDGGAGSDTAFFFFPRSQFVITPLANGDLQILHNGPGYTETSIFRNFETLQFSDQSVSVASLLNHPPVIDSNGGGDNATISISENTTAVTTVHAIDPEGDTLGYSLNGGADALLFQINPTTGALSFKTAPDYEHPTDQGGDNTYNVVVHVSDGHGGTDDQSLAITVQNVDDDDIIVGTPNADSLDGGLGNDSISGLAGDDTLIGNVGNDTVLGGDGNDLFIGGLGNDSLDGGNGADTVQFTAGATAGITVDLNCTGPQTIGGGFGVDVLKNIEAVTGSAFADRLTGDGANNLLVGGSGGFDTLVGGAGDDTLIASNAGSLLEGGLGNDSIVGGSGVDTISYEHAPGPVFVVGGLPNGFTTGADGSDNFTGIQNVIGSAYNDNIQVLDGTTTSIDGGAGNDSIAVAYGNDTLLGGAGDDNIAILWPPSGNTYVIDGGSGTDTLTWAFGNTGIHIDLNVTGPQNVGGAIATITGIENVTTTSSSGGDTIVGNALDNSLSASANSYISGGAGNDTLVGRGNADTLEGGAGNDSIVGQGVGDTVTYEHATGSVTVALGSGQTSGADGHDTITGVQNIIGSSYGDALFGDAGNNSISGGAGNDDVEGNGGSDTLSGGQGDDLLVNNGNPDGNDVFDGGAGNDTVQYLGTSVNLHVDLNISGPQQVGAATQTFTSIENVVGDAGNDTLIGNSVANLLDGRDGADSLSGGGGADTLLGGGGNDILLGGDGNDMLTGGQGADTMTGGQGADTFVFNQHIDSLLNSPDLITDFNQTQDFIDLRNVEREYGLNLGTFHLLSGTKFTGHAGEMILSYSGTQTNVSTLTIDANGDKVADMVINMTGHITGSGNFLLV